MAKVSDYAAYTLSLIGYTEGLLEAFPATNADGSINQEAQDKAVQQVVATMASSGLFQIPGGVSVEKATALAQALVATIQAYKTATSKTVL
jgi:hypothetical protein